MMIALGGGSYHSMRLDDSNNTMAAAVMLSGASSNLQPTLPVGQLDQNVQWNVWNQISSPRLTNLSKVTSSGPDAWRTVATNR